MKKMRLAVDIAEVDAMDILFEAKTTLTDGNGKAIGKMDDETCARVRRELTGKIIFQARIIEHTLGGQQLLSGELMDKSSRKQGLEAILREVTKSAVSLLKHPGYEGDEAPPQAQPAKESLILQPGQQPPGRIITGRF